MQRSQSRFRNSDEAFWSSEQRDNVLRCSCWVISFAAAGIASVRFGAIPFAFWFTLLLVSVIAFGLARTLEERDLFTLFLFGIHSQLAATFDKGRICLSEQLRRYAFGQNTASSRSGEL